MNSPEPERGSLGTLVKTMQHSSRQMSLQLDVAASKRSRGPKEGPAPGEALSRLWADAAVSRQRRGEAGQAAVTQCDSDRIRRFSLNSQRNETPSGRPGCSGEDTGGAVSLHGPPTRGGRSKVEQRLAALAAIGCDG